MMTEQQVYESELKRFSCKKDIMSLEMSLLEHDKMLFQATRKIEKLKNDKIEIVEKLAKANNLLNSLEKE